MSDGDRREKSLEVRWTEGGRAVDWIGLAMTGHRSLSVEITGLSVKAPQGEGGDFLITVRGLDEAGARVVSFHGSPDLLDALRGLQNRVANGSLRWRADDWSR